MGSDYSLCSGRSKHRGIRGPLGELTPWGWQSLLNTSVTNIQPCELFGQNRTGNPFISVEQSTLYWAWIEEPGACQNFDFIKYSLVAQPKSTYFDWLKSFLFFSAWGSYSTWITWVSEYFQQGIKQASWGLLHVCSLILFPQVGWSCRYTADTAICVSMHTAFTYTYACGYMFASDKTIWKK